MNKAIGMRSLHPGGRRLALALLLAGSLVAFVAGYLVTGNASGAALSQTTAGELCWQVIGGVPATTGANSSGAAVVSVGHYVAVDYLDGSAEFHSGLAGCLSRINSRFDSFLPFLTR